MINRRSCLYGLAVVAALLPHEAAPQQHPVAKPLVGFLSSRSAAESAHLVAAFRAGLGDGGYEDGRNVGIEFRWADGAYDRLPDLAADLVARNVTVLAAVGNTPSALAAKSATASIPIVFVIGDDPVALGLVSSLARPSGNVTGISVLYGPLGPKRMELISELTPAAATIAFLTNPSNTTAATSIADVRDAARRLGRSLILQRASTELEIDAVFANMAEQGIAGALIDADPFFTTRRTQLVALASRYRLPVVYSQRDFVITGGLAAYGGDLAVGYRQVGTAVAKILKGAKPADLPVMQATKIELAINLKTAKMLGLIIPPAVLLRADEVIE